MSKVLEGVAIRDSYHNRPEWSYSSMKPILDSGIDYAVGARMGLVPPPSSAAIDMGQLIHHLVLGGDEVFIESPFDSFRTKDAREWRDLQSDLGKIILTADMKTAGEKIAENIREHPYSEEYLTGKGYKHEQEMFAKTDEGVELRGKADAIRLDASAAVITDIKTTAQFDKFFKSASWSHYDLQASTYSLLGSSYLKIDPMLVNYYFCVAETVAPYRVQYMHASIEFVEAGERKLRYCIDEIVKFGNKQPSFLLTDIRELGDLSI